MPTLSTLSNLLNYLMIPAYVVAIVGLIALWFLPKPQPAKSASPVFRRGAFMRLNVSRLAIGLVIAGALLILVSLAVTFPRMMALYELNSTYDQIYSVLSNDLNFPDNESRVVALAITPLIALAWLPLLIGSGYLVARKISKKWLAWMGGAWLAWFVVFGSIPLLHATFGSRVCMKKNGTTDKWYVREPNSGKIILRDSAGTEEVGTRLRATPEICFKWAVQEGYITAREPRLVVYSPEVRFFDSTTNNPVVWYYRGSDGIELFDSAGYHKGQKLRPITPNAAAVIHQLERLEGVEEDAKKRNASKELKEEITRTKQQGLALLKAYEFISDVNREELNTSYNALLTDHNIALGRGSRDLSVFFVRYLFILRLLYDNLPGYDVANLLMGVPSTYDASLEAAVRLLQQEHGLKADGIFRRESYNILVDEFAKHGVDLRELGGEGVHP